MESCSICGAKNNLKICEQCQVSAFCSIKCMKIHVKHNCKATKKENTDAKFNLYRTEQEIQKEDSSNIQYSSSKYFATPKRDPAQQEEINRILALKDHHNDYDFYQILNLSGQNFAPGLITADQIKRSYYKISMKVHPDQGGDADAFNVLNEAYSVLSGEESRLAYDMDGMKPRTGSFETPDLAELFAAFFTVEVNDKYGPFAQKGLYLFAILWRILVVAWVAISVVTKDIYITNLKACLISGFSCGILSFAIWRSIFFTGCLFCFQFSFLWAFLFGFYAWEFRLALQRVSLAYFTFTYKRLFPLKTNGIFSGSFALVLLIFQYGFWESLFYGILIWALRDLIMGALGTALMLFRISFDSVLYASLSVLGTLMLFWYMRMGWLKWIISFVIGFLLTVSVYSKQDREDNQEEQEYPHQEQTSPRKSPRGARTGQKKTKK